MAMLDGLELGLALVKSPPAKWTVAVAKFETRMFPRAGAAAAESDSNAQLYKRVSPSLRFLSQGY